MLLKYLLVGIIFYYIVKTSGNLMQAIRGGLSGMDSDPRFDDHTRSSRTRSGSAWRAKDEGRSSSRRGKRWDGDIEDAKWEDLS
ncbi:MAG: hypothetical protein GVY35_12930 [Bacteroidetes bacterium]|jgi:hypothetical protein|nr:hypothetical protein [Bacteroidota bacterium]